MVLQDTLLYEIEFPYIFNNHHLLDDISRWKLNSLIKVAKLVVSAMEVRSSRYYALKYEEKNKKAKFTPKLEDLPLLIHWVTVHDVTCF